MTDVNKELVFSMKLENGELIDKTTFHKNKHSDPSIFNRDQVNCNTITIPEYTEWYKVYIIDGVEYIEFTHTFSGQARMR